MHQNLKSLYFPFRDGGLNSVSHATKRIVLRKLKVTIELDMDIPDEWSLLDHPDGVPVLAIGDGKYMYMSFLPMFTEELEPESTWSNQCSDEFASEVVEMVQGEDVTMKLVVN